MRPSQNLTVIKINGACHSAEKLTGFYHIEKILIYMCVFSLEKFTQLQNKLYNIEKIDDKKAVLHKKH